MCPRLQLVHKLAEAESSFMSRRDLEDCRDSDDSVLEGIGVGELREYAQEMLTIFYMSLSEPELEEARQQYLEVFDDNG